MEAVGQLEARRRRQLQVALEKGRKTKQLRQEVDRAVGRVGELIDRLRTLARELDSPVATSPPTPDSTPKAASKPAATRKPAATPKRAATRKPAATGAAPKTAAPRVRSKPTNA